ncbi:MAG: DUF4097 family beta strand repeat-containing protein [Bacteroidota bacterium]
MKNTILKFQFLFLSLFLFNTTFAQDMQSYSIQKNTGKLEIEGLDGLEIEGYEGTEIVVSTEARSKEKSERAKGLSTINAMGLRDNTDGLGLHVSSEGDKTIVRSVRKKSRKYVMKVPKGMAVSFKHSSHSMGKLYIHGMAGEVETSLQYGSVKIENVSGPLSINTVYGKIEAELNALNAKNPTSLYSVYALVDVSIPASTKANVHLSSSYGEMYTDFDVQVEANSKISSSSVKGTINGGGSELRINSTYQNIYLRKS